MGNLRACLVALVLVPVAACSNDSGNTKMDAPVHVIDAAIDAPKPIDAAPDAQTFEFSCAPTANPTTTQAVNITVSGGATTLNGTTPAAAPGVTVELFKNGSDTALDTQVSGSGGAFSFAAQPTNGSAVDIFVKATKDGARTDFFFPAAPLVADYPTALVLALSSTQLTGFGQTAGKGAFVLAVTDCATTPIGGASLSIQQGGTDVGSVFDLSQLSAQAKGAYFVLNVPPGDTTVIATVGSQVYRTRTVKSFADATTTTQLLP